MNESMNDAFLIGGLIRHKDLMEKALYNSPNEQLFDALGERLAATVWSVARNLFKAAGELPTVFMVLEELKATINTKHLKFDAVELDRFVDAIKLASPDNFGKAFVSLFLDQALVKCKKSSWVEQIIGINSPGEMKSFVSDASQEVSRMRSDMKDPRSNPLGDLENFLVYKERIPFGLPYLDILSGGGIGHGEGFGVLGPTGGGKTVMTTGMLCEKARRRKYAVAFNYEQETSGDITERLCSYLTGISINEFRDRKYADLSPEVKEAVDKVRYEMAPYVNICDLSQGDHGFGGVDEITTWIEKYYQEGRCPELVIIDWLGALVSRYSASTHGTANSRQKEQAYRVVAQELIDQLRRLGKQYGFGFVLFHQLSTEAARRSPRIKPVATEAYEFRAFSYTLDACYCIGPRSVENNICWFTGNKNRRNGLMDMLLKLDGEHVRFENVDGDFTVDHKGDFVKKGEEAPDVEQDKNNKFKNSFAPDI